MKFKSLTLPVLIIAVLSFPSLSFSEGDVEKGKKIFKKCRGCHTDYIGGINRPAPNLFGIVGSLAAQKKDYNYSSGMERAELTWNDATLNEFLMKPKAFIKNTKMTFAGLKDKKQRVDVIAYLKSLQ